MREPEPEIEPIVISLSEARHALRRVNRFELADRIRETLNEMSIILEDAHGKTTIIWKRIRDSKPPDIGPLLNILAEVIPILKGFHQHELVDMIQARLMRLNITLEDTLKGTVWKRER